MVDGNLDDLETFGTQTLLVTSVRRPDALIGAVVTAVLENFTDFRRLHPSLFLLKTDSLVANDAVAPLHPGAIRSFRTAGLLR